MLQRLLTDEIKRTGLSYRGAARQIGISHTTLMRLVDGKAADVRTLKKVAAWLEILPSVPVDMDAGAGQIDDVTEMRVGVLMQRYPLIEKVVRDILDRYEYGGLTAETLQEVANYAAYRLWIDTGQFSR